jgi:FkbM family methyltransferase
MTIDFSHPTKPARATSTSKDPTQSVWHKRSLGVVLSAIFRLEYYTAFLNTFRYCKNPIDFTLRYLLKTGHYPVTVRMRTPLGESRVTTYCHDDILTIHEIFLRGDYNVGRDKSVVVDFGSNIGISTIYFLSRNEVGFVYCYEPLPKNIDRFQDNTTAFQARYELNRVAVGDHTGPVEFGWEPTGRYGGINRDTGRCIQVTCMDANDELERVIAKHGRIDVLKVDIEGMEKPVITRIPPEISRNIGTIIVENRFKTNPLIATHDMKRRNWVTTFTPRSLTA